MMSMKQRLNETHAVRVCSFFRVRSIVKISLEALRSSWKPFLRWRALKWNAASFLVLNVGNQYLRTWVGTWEFWGFMRYKKIWTIGKDDFKIKKRTKKTSAVCMEFFKDFNTSLMQTLLLVPKKRGEQLSS